MVWDKRQGREKPEKIEQRKVKGPRTGVRTSGRTAACLSPICMGQAPRKKNTYKHIKREALSLSPPPPTTPHAGALLHSLLFFEDGFSCYLQIK